MAREIPDVHFRLENLTNGRYHRVGDLSTPTLREMRRMAVDESYLWGTLKVTVLKGDVGELLRNPGNKYATFQVASQLNALEMQSPENGPDLGVTGYSADRTQGPCCCIACGPVTVARNYFVRRQTDESGHLISA